MVMVIDWDPECEDTSTLLIIYKTNYLLIKECEKQLANLNSYDLSTEAINDRLDLYEFILYTAKFELIARGIPYEMSLSD
jgi:hypothetical protein